MSGDGSSGGGGDSSSSLVPQYTALQLYGRGSLYVYVVLTPPSYEQAHTSTAVLHAHTVEEYWKQTVPAAGSSPTAGWEVLSHPGLSVPHRRHPGASVGMRVPAAPVKRYQEAAARVEWLYIGAGEP